MKNLKIAGISIWRILAYFIIYSVIGYIIETMYAFVLYGVIESRQSFLYGPFCSIYGVGAVVMICALQRYKDKTHRLFIGGFVVRQYYRIYCKLCRRKIITYKMVGLFRQIFKY